MHEKLIAEFSEDHLYGEVFSLAEIPECWHDGDYICELDRFDILNALEEAADYVDEDLFEADTFGMSDTYCKVYASNEIAFKKALTVRLLALLKSTYGKPVNDGEE